MSIISVGSASSIASSRVGGKKKKTNKFSSFCFDQGLKINDPDDFIKASELWSKMTPTEKDQYNKNNLNRATRENLGQNEENKAEEGDLYTTFGYKQSDIDKEINEKKKDFQNMELTIESLLQKQPNPNALKALEFFLVSTSIYHQINESDVIPAEIAIAKFSLSEGIIDTKHFKVKPGKLPVGSAASVTERAKTTHKYPLPTENEENYDQIFKELMKFIGGTAKLQPLYAHPNDYEITQLSLEMLTMRAAGGRNIKFRVFPLEHLIYRMTKNLNVGDRVLGQQKVPSAHAARAILLHDPFAYKDLGCDFHIDEDKNQHCSLAVVKRSGFMMAGACLNPKFDKMLADKHIPAGEVHDEFEIVSISSNTSEFSDDSSDVLSSIERMSLNDDTRSESRYSISSVDIPDDYNEVFGSVKGVAKKFSNKK